MTIINSILKLISSLFLINRSILGPGFLHSLKILKKYNKNIKIKKIKSGTRVFDWVIPKEWICYNAYIEDCNGNKIIDFNKNNLHLVSYSKSVNKILHFRDLKKKLHFIKKKPNLIPYVTSYYKKDWGFCLSYNEYKKINKNSKYKVIINSKLKNGFLRYGEIFIQGKSKKEFIFTSYLCHPSMVNNELVGPTLLLALSKIIGAKLNNYSYRILIIPETIGSISYLSKNYDKIKFNINYGFVVTCIGDNSNFSFIRSKYEDTSINHDLNLFFKSQKKPFNSIRWIDDRTDSRQFNANKIDLPFVTLTRAGPGNYSTYHTSGDLLKTVVSKKSLSESLSILTNLYKQLDNKIFPFSNITCEPFLQKHNLYDHISKDQSVSVDKRLLRNFIAYANGKNSLEFIASKINCNKEKAFNIYKSLKKKKIIV